jgi:small ligand-binding sensory domain FIST
MSEIQFASAASREREPQALAAELAGALRAQLGERRPDLALVFLSGFAGQAGVEAAETIATVLDARVLLGCTAEGVITRDEEIEREPAATAMVACLPGLELAPVTLAPFEWPELLTGDPLAFRAKLAAPHAPRVFVVLADPFSRPSTNCSTPSTALIRACR